MAIQSWTTSFPVCAQPSADEDQDVTQQRGSEPGPSLAMRLLGAGVPLSLLLDLASPDGPDSERIAAAERAARG